MPRFALATWTLLSFFGPVLGDVQELEQKLQRLKAKADADPQTQQTLADLEQQLKGLKEQLKKTKDEMERSQKETAQADDRWAGACFAMAAEVRGGSISEEDMRFLERLAEGNVTLEEAAEVQLIRLATVCLGKRLDEGSEDYAKARELQFQFSRERKRGRVLSLPAEWVEEAEGAAVKEQAPWTERDQPVSAAVDWEVVIDSS
ncbi:unnamed protein product [Durusdinium trenchii]|uniref:Uncharacterized protein n=1 Tax=Durusdinium trenchii TaxID=1381693 RepID=A0ABP0NWP7_9DINO